MIIKKILALACLGWMGSLSCAGAADKSYCLLVDYSAVPALVNSRKITLNVNVGTCASVAVTVDGAPVTASYNSATGMASFTTTGSSVIVTAVNWTAGGTGAAAKATLYNNLRWAFSLTLDDGIQSQYVNAKPLLDAKGWRAGEAVVASWTNGGGANNYMSWTTVKALRAANWEIYNHTFTHPNPVNCGNFVTEFDQDQTAFTTQLPGYHVNHIVYPYEVSTASTCAGFPPSYLISGEVAGGLNFVDNPLPNVYLAGRNGLYGTDPTSLETMASGASANARPAWMIVITHSVSAGSGAPTDAYATNATALGNLLNYLDSNFGTGGSKNMWFAPSGEVMDYLFTRDKAVVSTCAVPATATPTRTNSPTATATSTLTRTVTSTPTRTSTFTPTLTRTSTATPTRTLTPTPTATSGGAWNSVFLQPNGTGGWTEPTVNLGGRNFKLDDYSYSGYKLSQAGLGDSIPCNNVTITATGDITAPLRTALTTLAGLGGGTLYIPGGTFTLSGTVTITAGNIRIMGTGSGATTILISSAYNPGDKLTEAPFTFMGGGGIGYNQWAEPARGPVTTSCGDVARGSLTVTVGSSAGFAVGNWVVVQQYFWPNFVSVNSANNWTTSPPGTGTDGAFNFTLCYPRKITAIAGNVITLDAPIPFGLKNSDATVWFYKPNAGQFIENDGIEGLTLQVQNNSNDGGRPAGTALAFKGIFNGWARDIKINNVAKNGFKPTWSTRITFLDCVVTGAQDTGGGGWGYGYYTYASSAVLFKRCSATNLRHNFTTENAMTNMVVYSRCNSVKTMGNSASVTMECDDTHYAYSQRILWDMMSQTNNGLLAENRDSQSTDAYETFGGGVVWNYSNTAGNPFGNWQANSVQCSPATITSDSDAQVIGTTGGATIFDNSQDLSAVYINGTVMTGAAPQVGPRGNVAYEGLNRAGLSPSSLFDAQLQTRLGSLPPDVAPASCGPTNTPTRTATATNSPSRTPTATPTSTTTSTSTATLTWTRTSTLTATLTVTNTSTSTPTNTRTNTVTNSATNTMSATPTLTSTFTRTSTNSSTPTLANTSTNSPTSSPTNTFTRTFTASFTATSTNTRSNTPTATSTATPTMTGTPPPTQTPTNTLSSTPTSTSSNTPTVTLTNTSTRTSTNTATSTSTPTFSNTMSPTPTSSRTPTASATFTHTSTNSLTSTFTPTVTFTPTNSFTGTTPPTNTPTYTATNSSTSTPTNTPTNTRTNTSTNSMTPSFTPTPTVTRTFTATPTSTLTSTNSPVFTLTPTATSVTVALSNGSFAPGNSTQLPGTSNVPVLQFQLNNPGISTVTLTNLTLTAGGGGNDGTGISGVSLYVDNNNNGILDGGDSLLQTTTYSGNNGTATFNFSTGIPAGNNRSYLVVDNFSGTANNTFQTGIANMTDLTGTNGTGAVNFTGAPLQGAVITLANATATPTNSPTRTATPVNTNTATNTATFTPTRTHTPTSTNTPTSTSTATISPTSSLTATFTPVFTATSGPHGKPTPILYPNPAPGPMVNILPPPYAGFSDVNVRLFTVAFRKVKEENFSNIPSGQAVPLELTDRWGSPLASGIYYAVVNTNAGRSVGKLLIQR